MTGIARRYEPAPPPPPPDEAYWTALLAQDAEADFLHDDEDIDWNEINHLHPLPHRDHIAYDGNDEDWQSALQAYEQDQTINLPVIGFNRGGLLVEWGSLRGFVPASQLMEAVSEQSHHQVLSAYIGQHLVLRVIEISQQQNRLILSERAAQVQPGTRATVLQNLQPSTIVPGVVTNVCSFGVFVDLGGVEGLIHISELSWGRVEHPAEVLNRGQEIEVFIMSVDRNEERIALSLKRLLPDPWMSVAQRYRVGQVTAALITSVVDFGAFACLEEGLEGLIHISELAEGHFLHPRNVVHSGQQVQVRILNIDVTGRRIGLSLRHTR
ncbi:MAG: S1 RNA-binding domain-containing protein [Anaerolineae bacterium]|nr:S1 RNA-binding domain-containing protein [Anaerolineae bacterium]